MGLVDEGIFGDSYQGGSVFVADEAFCQGWGKDAPLAVPTVGADSVIQNLIAGAKI